MASAIHQMEAPAKGVSGKDSDEVFNKDAGLVRYSSNIKVVYTNPHHAYLETGVATQDQVEAALNAVFKQIRETFPDQGFESASFRINVITDTEGKLYGVGYLWVSDPRVLNMLLGLNMDGSERVERTVDANWSAPTTPKPKTGLESLDTAWIERVSPVKKDSEPENAPLEEPQLNRPSFTVPDIKSWADLEDEENEIEKAYTPPVIEKKLPPIVRLPVIQLSKEQQEHYYLFLKNQAIKNGIDPEKIELPQHCSIHIDRSFAKDVKPGEDPNVLCCRIAPLVDIKVLKDRFDCYNTDPRTYIAPINGKQQHFKYPIYTFGDPRERIDKASGEKFMSRMIYVTYAPGHDAKFALQMNKKFAVKDANTGKEHLLIFSHWNKTQEGHQEALANRVRRRNENGPRYPGSNPSFSDGFEAPRVDEDGFQEVKGKRH